MFIIQIHYYFLKFVYFLKFIIHTVKEQFQITWCFVLELCAENEGMMLNENKIRREEFNIYNVF